MVFNIINLIFVAFFISSLQLLTESQERPGYFFDDIYGEIQKIKKCDPLHFENAEFRTENGIDIKNKIERIVGNIRCLENYSRDGDMDFECINGEWKKTGNAVCRLFKNIKSSKTTCEMEWENPAKDRWINYNLGAYQEVGNHYKGMHFGSDENIIHETIPDLNPGQSYSVRLSFYIEGDEAEHVLWGKCRTKN